MAAVVQSAKSLATYFNQSSKFQRELISAQAQLQMPSKSLVQAVETRWNSSFYCLQSIIENQKAIRLAAIDSKRCPSLSEEDVEVMTHAVETLRPVQKISMLLESRSECISSVLPAFHAIRAALHPNLIDSEDVRELKETIRSGLEKRMVDYQREKFLVLATCLDPRYKLHTFSPDDRAVVKVMLQVELSKDAPSTEGLPPSCILH